PLVFVCDPKITQRSILPDSKPLIMNRPRIPTAILDAKGSLLHHPELRDSSEPTGRQMSKTVPKDFACVDACPEVCHHAEQRRLWKELMQMMAPGVALASDRWAVIHLVVLEAKSRAGLTSNGEEMRLLHYLDRFGLNPASRSKVSIPAPKESALQKFLKQQTKKPSPRPVTEIAVSSELLKDAALPN